MKIQGGSKLTWVIYNIFRLIPMAIFTLPFFIFYLIESKTKAKKTAYADNKKYWDSIASLADLQKFAFGRYKYHYDLGWGLMDHDSSKYEWNLVFGDCDDIALYTERKLKSFGYDAIRIGLIGKENGLPAMHFDCLFIDKATSDWCLFNYGDIIRGSDEKELFLRYGSSWSTFKNAKYTKCII